MAAPRISTAADIEAGLDALVEFDSRLEAVRAAAGPVPLRLVEPGLRSLVSIIIGQQVSRASAMAISGRLFALIDPLTPAALAAGEKAWIEAGLSRPKQRTIAALCTALERGLDLSELCALEPAEALGRMTAVPGIGPWTAEVYLLTAAGHPDILPARDVALQAAVADGLCLPARPDARMLAGLAESWAPWRSVAARLFWAFWARQRRRDAMPV